MLRIGATIRRTRLGRLATGFLALVALLATPAAARPEAPPALRTHSAALAGATDALAAQGLRAPAADLAIVQFSGPITPADQAGLLAAGVAILEYLPDYAYVVRGDQGALASAAALPGVAVRHPFTAADRVEPGLLRALGEGALDQPLAVVARPWPGEEAALAAELAAAGLDLARPIAPADLLRLVSLAPLRWVEPAIELRVFNSEARAIIGVAPVWQGLGLYGAGQIIGVADSGLDTGDLATLSPDFAGRIVATHVLSDGGDLADELGHGTHVLGSAAGAGIQSGADPARHAYAGSFAGVAPEAGLVVQAFELGSRGEVIGGLGADPYPIFAQAYASGARVHTNSWGGYTGLPFFETIYGAYPLNAQRTDAFIWEHRDMAIFFAAGNSGEDALFNIITGCLPFGDGVVDPDSLAAPGTAKNVITVGASEGLRANAPASAKTWRDFSSNCFAFNPIAGDKVSDNANGMAAFSSRGPTDDGRVKPDLVAPGTNILSNRSHTEGASNLWGAYGGSSHYVFAGGTSMATPLAAGAGVLMRQWLVGRGYANPSAAALKAALLTTTADMGVGQYGSGAAREIPAARPNNVAGWGRVDLRALVAPPPFRLWLDDRTAGLATGQAVTYTTTLTRPLAVASADTPLRVTLAWSDPPASLSAARQLVNDLDLTVIGPDGRAVRGNGGAAADRVNNVEGLIIARPAPGAYTIVVRAHNVPVERQPYAIAVSGALVTATPNPAPSPTPRPAPSPTPAPAPTPHTVRLPFVAR